MGNAPAIPMQSKNIATALGFLAVLFWGSNMAFTRSLSEDLGIFTAGAWIYLGGSALSCLHMLGRRELSNPFRFPRKYFLLCAFFFVVNLTSFYFAIGFASGRRQVLEVGLVNYLWPSLTLLLSVPLLGKKPGALLLPGMILAFLGILISSAGDQSLSFAEFWRNCRANTFSYAMAFVAAFSWGFYSCYSRSLGGAVPGNPIPFFLLLTGLVLLASRPFFEESSAWSLRTVLELAFAIVFPTFLAYTFWDVSMKKGNVVLVLVFSYFTPLLSMLIAAFYLRTPANANLWLGCVLVIAGAAVCKVSIRE